ARRLLRPVCNGLARTDVDVEHDRLAALRPDLDVMRSRFEIQMLEATVEVVDGADVVAICVDAGVTWRVGNPEAAVVATTVAIGDVAVAAAVRISVAIGVSVPKAVPVIAVRIVAVAEVGVPVETQVVPRVVRGPVIRPDGDAAAA